MAGGTLRRRGARLCVVAALACLAQAASADGAEPAERPEVFRGTATALVGSAMLDRAGLLPVPEVLRFIALDGESAYEPFTQSARASVLFPGNGVLLGPGLACGTFGEQFPDEFEPVLEQCLAFEYPLTVAADPLAPERSTEGSLILGEPTDPISVRAVGASAVATPEVTTTDATITDLRLLGMPEVGPLDLGLPIPGLPELDPSVLSIESALSRTDQRIDAAGRLVVTAEATLSGLRLAGGLVEIGSIRSAARVTDDGTGGKEHEATLEVTGVTVAGVPAELGPDGLVVDSSSSGPIAQQLGDLATQLLQAMGVSVTVLDIDAGVGDDGIAFARAEGLLIELAQDVAGLPGIPGPLGELDLNGAYVGSIQLGTTGVTGIAYVVEPFETVAAVAPGPQGAAPSPDPPAAPATAVAAPEAAPSPPGAGATEQATIQRITRTTTGDVVADLRWLYLAVTLSALGLCIAPGVSLPHRLGRTAP